MKKLILCLLFALVIGIGTSAQAATYEYSLDISLLAGYAGLSPETSKIGGFEYIITGGTPTSFLLGDAIPTTGNWIEETFGTNASVYDDYSDFTTQSDFVPVTSSGNVITYFSDVQLAFSGLNIYDAFGITVPSAGNYSTDGFQETVVPIPGSILLLGSGLVGLIGIARRKRS